MKKVFIFIFVSILCTSCEDHLLEVPKGDISANQFFNNEAEAEAAVFGVYRTLNLKDESFNRWFETYRYQGADLVFTARPMPNTRLFAINDLTTSDGSVLTMWKKFYEGIKNANLVINRISQSSLEESVKARLVAETIFLRAIFYHYLTTFWGDVPYWTDELEIEIISEIGMTSKEEIRISLLEELSQVENDLSSGTYASNGGRASKWSVKMLKAWIYMWEEDWDNAIVELEAIINESPHILLSGYGDVFRAGNELNDEIVFGVEFLMDELGAEYHSFYRPRTVEEEVDNPGWFNGVGIFTPYENYAGSFSENDLRKPYCILKSLNSEPLNFIYMPKFMRVPLPEIDPLIVEPEPRYNSSIAMNIMRLADAYLRLSEAENELNGPTDKAFQYLNIVRNRAGLDNLSDLSQEELRKAIRRERAWELAGEGEGRRMDLIRWGIYVETIRGLPQIEQTAINNDPTRTERFADKALFEAQYQADRISEKHTVLPVPSSEIEKNSNLTQHPLWQ